MKPENLEQFVGMGLSKPASVMIDYHYCSHDISSYKSEVFKKSVGLVRLCSRREDITSAVKFGRILREELGVKLSLNFFNITNYSRDEIKYCIENASKAGAEFLYFADTHGALDLYSNSDTYRDFAEMIVDKGMVPGLHLHDHSGKAYMNYRIGQELGFQSFDFSLGGMGKGVGNLRLEHVINTLDNPLIIDLLEREECLRMPSLVPGLITAALSATDYYAVEAAKRSITPSALADLLRKQDSSTRDIFDSSLFEGMVP